MTRSLLFLGMLCASWSPLPAQVTEDFTSPRGTMFTFLDAVNDVRDGNDTSIVSATASLDLSAVGIDPASNEARQVARQLWASLNRIRLVEASELPTAATLRPTDSVFVYFPRPFNATDEAIRDRVDIGTNLIAFARQPDGRWLFSAETMSGIGALSAALSQLPAQVRVDEESLGAPAWVLAIVPEPLRIGAFLGVRYWQWMGLLVLIFSGVIADYMTRSMLRPIVRRAIRAFQVDLHKDAIQDLVRAAGLLAAAMVWWVFFPALALVDAVQTVVRVAVGVFVVLTGTLTAWRATDLVGAMLMARAVKSSSKFDDILVPLLRKTAKLFILAFGIVYGAQTLNINIVPLLTGLGIGGLAFAFAAKDTIENLFGSVAVVLDRPFEVGDWVVIDDVEGTIEEMGFRSTRIRTFYNSVVTMPNAALVRATVDNYGRRTYRRWKTTLGVQYDTSPEKLLAFAEGIRELVRRHPYTRKDYSQVWCNDFADSSINILVYVFHEVPDWSTELRERERLLIDIFRLANKLGVEFAFPTQTLHVQKHDPDTEAQQYQIPQGSNDRQAMRAGALAAKEITRGQPWRKEIPPPVDSGGANAGAFDESGD
jgi:MscS family membrane protein